MPSVTVLADTLLSVPDDVDEGALLAALDGGGRDDRGPVQDVEEHRGVDELVGEERLVVVLEDRTQLEGARRRVDRVVDVSRVPVASLAVLSRLKASTGIGASAASLLQDPGDIVLRKGEDDRDRLDLREEDDAVRIARRHVVALVDLPQADPAGDRRGDVAVGEVQLRAVHGALVRLCHPLVLGDQRPLRVDLLLRDGVLRRERDVAVEVDLRLLELRLRLEELPLGLLEGRLVGARVDDRKDVALVHHLALGELDIG